MSTETDTLPVAYVGPRLAGVVINATGQRVRPVGSPPIVTVDEDDVEHDVPTEVEVPAELARQLVAQDVWQPVGWSLDEAQADDTGEGDGESGGDGDGESDGYAGTFPNHRGGGVYDLSDGSTVRGKDDAISAQAALDAAPDQTDAAGIGDDSDASEGDDTKE